MGILQRHAVKGASGFPYDTTNAEGKPAFGETLEEAVARTALTGIIKNEGYVDDKEIAQGLIDITREAAEKNPGFLLKAAKVSRRANFKAFPKLAALALMKTPLYSPELEAQLTLLLSTYGASQLLEIVRMTKASSKKFGGLGRRAQRVFGKAMQSWNRGKRNRQLLAQRQSVRALLRLVHPKVGMDFHYALGDSIPGAFNADQAAMLSILQLQASAAEHVEINPDILDRNAAEIIREFRLNYGSLKGVLGNRPFGRATWEAVRDNMSTIELLINLRALHERGVMDPIFLAQGLHPGARLVPEDVLRAIEHAPWDYRETLINFAAEAFTKRIPGLDGKRVGLALDVSPSMYWRRGETSPYSAAAKDVSATYWGLASVIATSVINSCSTAPEVVYFDIKAWRPDMPGPGGARTPFLKDLPSAQVLRSLFAYAPSGDGTSIGAGIAAMPGGLDVIFVITDEEENRAKTALNAWLDYKKANPQAHLVILNVSAAKWHSVQSGRNGVTIIQSVTPLIFDMLGSYAQSGVDFIESHHAEKSA